MKKNKGFTLIELVMVIVILGTLAAIAMPKYVDMRDEALRASAKATINSIRSAIAIQYAKNALNGSATFPSTSELTATGSSSIFVEGHMPNSPIDNANSVKEVNSDPITSADVDNTTAYLYNPATGEIRYNNDGDDGTGTHWYQY